MKFLKSLFVSAPLTILFNIVRLLFLVLVLPVSLIVRLLEWLKKLCKSGNLKPHDDSKGCHPPFPEDVMRRPDPCIYSQQYLTSQGVSVTWNNPDVWFAKAATPNSIEADSYHLQDNTDYIVFVQSHNASTDLALGVQVRLLYRPWSFNSPDLLPVDIDASGNEVVKYVNISPMGATITQFKWHTPDLLVGETSKHICLQVHLSHPLDINPLNNMGQENTAVFNSETASMKAGEMLNISVPLFNNYHKQMQYVFLTDSYRITEEKIELKLKKNIGTEKRNASRTIANFVPTLHEQRGIDGKKGEVLFARKKKYTVVRARYTGYDEYEKTLSAARFPLAEGLTVVTNNNEDVRLEKGEIRDIPFAIQMPPNAQDGQEFTVNIKAKTTSGQLIGGVSLSFTIKN